MAAVKPVAKCIYVCDDVIADPVSGKVSLLNLWDTVRVPADRGFPYTLGKICVFVWWRDGAGEIRTRVEIADATSDERIHETQTFVLRFQQRTGTIFARYLIAGCTFPHAGNYVVEVYCEDEFVDDQLIRVLEG
jgi:hypothetical protein